MPAESSEYWVLRRELRARTAPEFSVPYFHAEHRALLRPVCVCFCLFNVWVSDNATATHDIGDNRVTVGTSPGLSNCIAVLYCIAVSPDFCRTDFTFACPLGTLTFVLFCFARTSTKDLWRSVV